MHLFEDFGELLATATTDAQGEYFFDVIPPQDVYVDFELPASGWEFTIANVGVGVIDFVDSDADPNTGETITFPISAGVWSTKWDAGLRSVAFFADGFWTAMFARLLAGVGWAGTYSPHGLCCINRP